MKMAYRGDLDAEQQYAPGDIVKDNGGGYRVRSYNGNWVPVAAPADRSLVGPPGRDGRDGERGADGRDGAPGADGEGFRFRGAWKRREVYRRNDVATMAGSSWVCVAPSTNTKPGITKSWGPLALRGEDGADGKDGRDGMSQSVVRFRREVVQGPQLALTAASDFAAGDAAFAMGDGRAGLAIADGEPQTLAIGVALAATQAGWPVQLATSGLVTCPSWSWSQPGATLYLSPTTPGGLTTDYPTEVGAFVVIMGTVVGPTQINLNIHWANYIGA